MTRKLASGWVLTGLLAATAATAGLAGAGLAHSGSMMHGIIGHAHMMAADPAAMDAHLDKMLAEMLPDGTSEQKSRLKAIAKGVHADLATVHGQLSQTHRQLFALLLQPTIDRAALESLRVAQIRQMDVVSKRVMTALADAAEVLTPAQRAALAAHHKQH